MFLEKITSAGNCSLEAKRYKPAFDLRKNIAMVLAHYSLIALQKNIVLDIFVSHETPNYFLGNVSGLREMLSQLLRYSIDSLATGEISIRVHNELVHHKNNCETELEILITTYNPEKNAVSKKTRIIQTVSCSHPGDDLKLQRVKHLCEQLDGHLTIHEAEGHITHYTASLVLLQAHCV